MPLVFGIGFGFGFGFMFGSGLGLTLTLDALGFEVMGSSCTRTGSTTRLGLLIFHFNPSLRSFIFRTSLSHSIAPLAKSCLLNLTARSV